MPQSRPRTVSLLIPAVTFLVGLVLGGVVVFAGQSGGGASDGSGAPSPSASASAGGSGDVAVTVPGSCGRAAENLQEATTLLRSTIGSVKDFAPKELVDTLNRLEALDKETRPLVTECSQVKVEQASASPTP